jgi:hypothetical protein
LYFGVGCGKLSAEPLQKSKKRMVVVNESAGSIFDILNFLKKGRLTDWPPSLYLYNYFKE